MKTKLLICAFLFTGFTSAMAGDSDRQVCSEIRSEAVENCKSELSPRSQKKCYFDEVARMVDENNFETADLPGGGDLQCEY